MPFRTVCITNRCKLEYSLNYLIYKGEEEKRIHLSEINTLIIQSTGVAVTTALLSELVERKIKVIFCDSKMNPQSELIPYYGSHNTSDRIKEQVNWTFETLDMVWKDIVRQKIKMQRDVLAIFGHVESAQMLDEYMNDIAPGDTTNREGHAAKVYFNSAFGKDFNRAKPIPENAFLNYGYSILLSAFNREIVSHGYLTQIGIHHKNEYNHFNLACDMMEPFRPIVDHIVLSGVLDEKQFKHVFNKLLTINVTIQDKSMSLDSSIHLYVQSVVSCIIANGQSQIHYIQSYELPIYENHLDV